VKTGRLQTTRVSVSSDLTPYLDAWRELARAAPMQSPEWLLTWWDIYAAPDDELAVLLLHEPGGNLVGLAPLYLHDAGRSKTFRLLGAADYCTHHMTWLTAAGWEERVGVEVGRFLLECRPSWKRLLFESVDADATAVLATVEFLAENGCLRHVRQTHNCWKITLPGTWEEYLLMLSRSLRKRCRKLQRQFFDSDIIKIRQVENEMDLKKGFETLLKLHAARWGSPGKPLGVYDDGRFRTFHETVSRKLLARKQLRLAWLERDGEPLAVEYQFVDARAVYAYQAGIALSVNDEYSPGKLTMMAAIQFALARGCRYFDLLSGDEPYKANWRAVPMACYDIRLWQRRGSGRLEWLIWQWRTTAVGRLKRSILGDLVRGGRRLYHAMKKYRKPGRRDDG
jgi:CelD/BcsL family acetyltransferase involved in cellulose biosynthesis